MMLFSLFIWEPLWGQTGVLRGHIRDTNGSPIEGVALVVSTDQNAFPVSLASDSNGFFQITGLRAGSCSLHLTKDGFEAHTLSGLQIESGRCLTVSVNLSVTGSRVPASSHVIKLDPTQNSHETTLTTAQIYRLPLAHNIWSLIENLDLSATSNRIDVGGLWSGIPALFSARGGGSWTQSRYALNGMDITDPFSPGRPLLYPDFYALSLVQHRNAGFPAHYISPGGHFDLFTKRGSDRFQGSVSTFYINHSLQADNITPELEAEGLHESHKFNYMLDGNVQISGPLIPGKLTFFTSISAFDLSRNIADYQNDDLTSLLSGQVELNYLLPRGLLRILWTGQRLDHASYGADRYTPASGTTNRHERYDLLQAIWETRISSRHSLRAGLNYVKGRTQDEFQDDIPGPYGRDIFSRKSQGAAPWAGEDGRRLLTLQVQGEALFSVLSHTRHRLQYGMRYQNSSASTQARVWEDIHLHFYEGSGLEVIRFNSPIAHEEKAWHLSFHVQDAVTFGDFLTIHAGLNVSASRGTSPSNEHSLSWFNLAPRMGIAIPLNAARTSCLKVDYARYYFTLPLQYLTYGSSTSWGGLVYVWNDVNSDLLFQENEQGEPLRREGPYYSAIAPEVKRPATDEISLSYQAVFARSWYFQLGGFYRRTHNLVRVLNVGVPPSAYDPQHFVDRGDDDILYTLDDQIFTVYNQKRDTFGQDQYLLTNLSPDARTSLYFGLDLNLIKKIGEKFTFFLSLTATQAEGETNPGNTEFENDDGVLGDLLYNPNNLINARGRMRFDRAYTGRIGFDYRGPWDLRLGCVIKYYDGQPFSRQIVIEGLNQGPFYIQAHPRGKMRYEYNRTVDLRVEKMLSLRSTRLRIILDAFNLLNRALATEENPWSGPDFQARYATEVQSPRVIRLGLVLEF